ncbi:leucyl/phenylalanyl-tRNA--protein transferase [Desulfobotulus sp.]|jgi:leucyl/phenylalanyl-tRNA--protein transferase|uniref:leucyl/phenylalanyl-tRNA--protein transferase n=1 Tax=Desulfobotulus sp. TaxID=1940337 RepID=UPI002A36F022|nr:leucyl/phenylalanyl-tRNA--protein transferase [Desulfobotulus sp.]MDY0162980.1 leucyl/phenylalanyl-tRNA--protein transferase [Desulfobotulus sp.]
MPVFQLGRALQFPPADLADASGLLAIGGDLSIPRLLLAYREGIFPWYSKGDPILWWSPDPRVVLYPDGLHVSKSLGKRLRRGVFSVTMDTAFEEVLTQCAAVRTEKGGETWLMPEMARAYQKLHAAGYAHSVETWDREGRLCGGLYGVSLGRIFFGESMFSRVSDASKVALVVLVRQLDLWGFDLIDCQVQTAHLLSMGAQHMGRRRFMSILKESLRHPTLKGPWTLDPCLALESGVS